MPGDLAHATWLAPCQQMRSPCPWTIQEQHVPPKGHTVELDTHREHLGCFPGVIIIIIRWPLDKCRHQKLTFSISKARSSTMHIQHYAILYLAMGLWGSNYELKYH